jgi:hypothetical protein
VEELYAGNNATRHESMVVVSHISPLRTFVEEFPQQVSPVLCAACARQKTHGAACRSFAVGFVVFSTKSKKQQTPP